jgi:hypothetical protein
MVYASSQQKQKQENQENFTSNNLRLLKKMLDSSSEYKDAETFRCD